MNLTFEMYILKNHEGNLPIYYKFTETKNDKIWLQNQDGEGGEFDGNLFYDVIDKFFKENF